VTLPPVHTHTDTLTNMTAHLYTHNAFSRFPAPLTKLSILYQFAQFSHLNEMQIQFPEQRKRRTGGKLNGLSNFTLSSENGCLIA